MNAILCAVVRTVIIWAVIGTWLWIAVLLNGSAWQTPWFLSPLIALFGYAQYRLCLLKAERAKKESE